MHLDTHDVNALVDIAIDRGVKRDLLVAALRPSVQAALKTHQSPGDQLLADFQWLNGNADNDEGIDRLVRVLEQMEYLLKNFADDQAAVRAIRLGLSAPQGHQSEGRPPPATARDWIWLALGVGVLGGLFGFVSGLSTQRGVTGDLLMALAALAAGGALSLALVRWRRGSAPLPVAPLGVGLLLFVGLMLLGLLLGMRGRDQMWFAPDEAIAQYKSAQSAASDCPKPGTMRSGECEADDPRGYADRWQLDVERKFNSVHNACGRMLPDYAPVLLVCAEASARMGGDERLQVAEALANAARALDPEVEHLDRVKTLVDQKKGAP